MSVLKGSAAWSWIEYELKYERYDIHQKPQLSSDQILVFDMNKKNKRMKINFKWLLFNDIRLLNVYEKIKFSSIHDCEEKCENDSRCLAFSFGNLECHLSEVRTIVNYKYIGCFNKENNDENLKDEKMTIDMCYEYCLNKLYPIFGLQLEYIYNMNVLF